MTIRLNIRLTRLLPVLALAALFAGVGLSPASAKTSGEPSARQQAAQSTVAQSRAARRAAAKKAEKFEPFCVRPFEYPRNVR